MRVFKSISENLFVKENRLLKQVSRTMMKKNAIVFTLASVLLKDINQLKKPLLVSHRLVWKVHTDRY